MNSIFSYKKLIIEEGHGKYKPNEFSECSIHLHLPEEQASTNIHDSVGYQLETEIQIVVGHGMTHMACIVDLCVQTMFEGERCTLETKCISARSAAADDFVTLEVTLLSFSAATDLCNISYEEKLKHAVTLKTLGMSAYSADNLSAAFHKFSRSLKYFTCATVDDKPSSSCTGENVLPNGACASDSNYCVLLSDSDNSNLTHEDIDRLICHTWLNLAACQLRCQNFKLAAVNCSKALKMDPNNVKGLFRRAQCNVKTGNEHAAVSDLERALTLDPGNREIIRLLSIARQLTRKSDDKLAAAMSKMFR